MKGLTFHYVEDVREVLAIAFIKEKVKNAKLHDPKRVNELDHTKPLACWQEVLYDLTRFYSAYLKSFSNSGAFSAQRKFYFNGPNG